MGMDWIGNNMSCYVCIILLPRGNETQPGIDDETSLWISNYVCTCLVFGSARKNKHTPFESQVRLRQDTRVRDIWVQ
jgi:hypothetical protein